MAATAELIMTDRSAVLPRHQSARQAGRQAGAQATKTAFRPNLAPGLMQSRVS